MAPKRKSDAMEQTTLDLPPVAVLAESKESNVDKTQPAAKTARVSADASSSKTKGKAKDVTPKKWSDITLEGEDEVRVSLSSSCKSLTDISCRSG